MVLSRQPQMVILPTVGASGQTSEPIGAPPQQEVATDWSSTLFQMAVWSYLFGGVAGICQGRIGDGEAKSHTVGSEPAGIGSVSPLVGRPHRYSWT